MNKKILADYVLLEQEAKAIEEKKQVLRDEIVKQMQKEGLEKLESTFGSFTVAKRITYSYSEKVKDLEDKVKIAKDKEQKKGLATEKITNYLLYKKNV